MLTLSVLPFDAALMQINCLQREVRPRFTVAAEDLALYARFRGLAELDRLLFPQTNSLTTAARFLDRSPAELRRTRYSDLSEEIEARFVAPFAGLFPQFDNWTENFLDGNDPMLAPYPIGPGFTTEDLDLDYIDLDCMDPGYAFFWLFNADWAVEPEARAPGWAAITRAFGFTDAPLPVKTLGLLETEYGFDPQDFRQSLEAADLADVYLVLTVALGETESPFVDYRPFEDGMLPWELDFTPENLQYLMKLYNEGQEIMQAYELALSRLQAEPARFARLIDLIETAHFERRRK